MATALQDLINIIKTEDSTLLQSIIKDIDASDYSWGMPEFLTHLTTSQVARLTTSQITLLKNMRFKRGQTLRLYRERCIFATTISGAHSKQWAFMHASALFAKEDLIYLSKYETTKWKEANPSGGSTKKGTELNFAMDDFSLALFKASITKGFLRTEAKNYILAVNKAYSSVTATDPVKKLAATKIRNKFYAVILNNTEVHTNAMLKELQWTDLEPAKGGYYQASEDEALSFSFGGHRHLLSYTTTNAMETYSTDIEITTHNNGTDNERHADRLASATSILLTIHAATGNTAYLALATRMLKNITSDSKIKVLNTTSAVAMLRAILTK